MPNQGSDVLYLVRLFGGNEEIVCFDNNIFKVSSVVPGTLKALHEYYIQLSLWLLIK